MAAPSRIGPYEIVRQLGKSLADVYLAVDTVANRPTALKLIKNDSDRMTEMVVEAERRGAAIQRDLEAADPRVIKIYDFGDTEGYFFIAMQYVEGCSLAEILRSERTMSPGRAATIAVALCEQLAKFHSWHSAVVHGDIKPSNIHLGPNDTVRLLDFGIAKMLRANRNATLHQFGSPGYCSPERLSRSEVDHQSDLWAVAATLYEMLAGTPPYQADSTRKLENLIRSGRPPRALPSSCPRALRAIVTKALAADPARRYASALEFQQDLQAFLQQQPTLAERQRHNGWDPQATIEVAREYIRKATRKLHWSRVRLEVAAAVAWFLAGMALWIGGGLAWQQYKLHRAAASKPILPPDLQLPALYIATADQVLSEYRASSDSSLHDFDWQKAEVCLARAVDLGSTDDLTRGKLALARGYASLERLNGGDYAEAAARRVLPEIRDLFASAVLRMPHDPAPHFALARTYVYSMPNVELAMREFAAARRLGGVLGYREVEQQGDAYRLRAEREAAGGQWNLAVQDRQTARQFYARIPVFDQVETHVQELNALRPPPPPKPVRTRRPARWR